MWSISILTGFVAQNTSLVSRHFFVTKYKDRPLGVIVAVGVGALQYVLRSRAELWPAVPVVFTFVDPQLLSALSLPADVTGTTFRLKLSDMVSAGRVVVPDLNQIAVVGDPLDTLVPYRHMQDEIPAVTATGLQIIDLTGMPMRDVRARVANLPARTAILYPGMYSDGEGTYLTPVEGLRRFADAANRPIIVTAETQLGPGTGGYIAVPSAIGQGAAVQVLAFCRANERRPSPSAKATSSSLFSTGGNCSAGASARARCHQEAKSAFASRRSGSNISGKWWRSACALVTADLLIVALIYEDRRRRRSEANAQMLMGELAHMNRVVTAGQLTASIAHEIRQPLGSIATLRQRRSCNWLKHDPPNLDEVRSGLENIVKQVHRADDVIKSVTALFKNESTTRTEVYVNELVQQVLISTARARSFEWNRAGNEFHRKPAAVCYGRSSSVAAGHSESDHECNRSHVRFQTWGENAAY